MNLEDKVNRILPAIRFISEHDDATEGMVRAALGEVAAAVRAELDGLRDGRARRKAAREAREAERKATRDRAG